MPQLGKFGALEALVQDEQLAREERILKAWCEEEGLDYASLSEQEKMEYWFNADTRREEKCLDNSQFGLGA